MAAIAVHKFAQCITCHAWSPDHSSKMLRFSSTTTHFACYDFFVCLFFFFSFCLVPRKRRKRNAQLMDPIHFVFTGEFHD